MQYPTLFLARNMAAVFVIGGLMTVSQAAEPRTYSGDTQELARLSYMNGQAVRVVEAQPLVGTAKPKPAPTPLAEPLARPAATVVTPKPVAAEQPVVQHASLDRPAYSAFAATPTVLTQTEVPIRTDPQPNNLALLTTTSRDRYDDGYRDGYRNGYGDGTYDSRPRYVYRPAPVIVQPAPVVYCPPVYTSSYVVYRGGHWGGGFRYSSGWGGPAWGGGFHHYRGPRYYPAYRCGSGSSFGFGLSLRF